MDRTNLINKCFCSWDVDKKRGKISIDEISRMLITYKGDHAKTMCRLWVSMLHRGITCRSQLIKKTEYRETTMEMKKEILSCFLSEKIKETSQFTGPLGTELEWEDMLCVEDDIAADEEYSIQQRSGNQKTKSEKIRHFSITLPNVSPSILLDVENYITSLRDTHTVSPEVVTQFDSGIRTFLPQTYEIIIDNVKLSSSRISHSGISRDEARVVLLELCEPIPDEEYIGFIDHITITLDFIYNVSYCNQRNKMLWELFRTWDYKDCGYIDKSDLIRRLLTVTANGDQNRLHSVVEEQTKTEDISLNDFRNVMTILHGETTDVSISEILRMLKRQLRGDDDTKDSCYSVCRHLRSEAEQQSKRNERMYEFATRKSSLNESVREAATADMMKFKVLRLRSTVRHAFDSVSFDDISMLLEQKVPPPATRILYESLAAAFSALLDIQPLSIDGRIEYWPVVIDALRGNMVGILNTVQDFNISSVSYVRVCRCTTALWDHSSPSHVLSHSWFLSAVSEWSRAVCELACVERNWEWPPAPLSANNAVVSHSNSTSGVTTGAAIPPRPPGSQNSGSGMSAVRGLSVRRPLSCRSELPQSPFRASNLFARKRKPKSESWQQFVKKLEAADSRTESNSIPNNETNTQNPSGGRIFSVATAESEMPTLNEADVSHYKVCT